ncbi:probable aspartic proteinase GIP2 [Cornus florida]|uniref:probable aspartic proteinase GIP2 n=1 Tax=Cornus florida TaxID=4283 RepID=UPI00289A5681|nr:probable aspartic proteinase GIP2 [Cornus florida]
MASSLQHLLFSFIFMLSISVAQRPSFPNHAMLLPVTKQLPTLQYLTHIHLGTPLVPITLVVDLGGPFLWVDSASTHVSSSYQPIKSGSLQCSMANTNNSCQNYGNCLSRSNTCTLCPENSITTKVTQGDLAEDTIAVRSELGQITAVHHFLFSSAPTLLLKGLASGVKGVLGLGRSRIALPSQLANTVSYHRKFTVCLSSSEGVIISGESQFATDISKSLMYTPLITTDQGGGTLREYYINVKSIKINGKRLSIDTSLLGIGGTTISTIVPYTTLESTVYETLSKAYIKVANVMNMTRVASVAPFGLCFSSKGIENTRDVPVIDLMLQSEMVKWRIHGRNSMVKVSDEVMCLGMLDGGVKPRASIVIGGYQLEDNLLEFNLATSMLGFSSSLLMRQTSCSSLKLYSMSSHESI